MSNEYYTTKNAVHENEQNGHGVKRKLKIVSPCKLKALVQKHYLNQEELSSKEMQQLNQANEVIASCIINTLSKKQYDEMAGFILTEITNKNSGEDFFGDSLGFIGYTNVEGAHDSAKQAKHVQRVQQPYHMMECKKNIPYFLQLYQTVERMGVNQFGGLDIMYFDILVQTRESSTVYKWHVDDDIDNNPGEMDIYRTVIVKITPGKAVGVQVAGHETMWYDDVAGACIHFRSNAVHRSVLPADDAELISCMKLVFFLGRNQYIFDGRERSSLSSLSNTKARTVYINRNKRSRRMGF